MQVAFVLLIGVVVGSTVPMILSRNDLEHVSISIMMAIGGAALVAVTGILLLVQAPS